MSPTPRTYVVAISGASGAPYARRLLEVLVQAGARVLLIATPAGRRTWKTEVGPDLPGPLPEGPGRVEMLADADIGAGPASGSFRHDGMVVCPCSMKTLAAVANGLASTLTARAADVALKERRRLVLVTRESPLNLIHIENMAQVTRAGGIILPAEPGFYHRPSTVDDLIDFVVQRIADVLDVPTDLAPRWSGGASETREGNDR